jgi:hypothetical protein
MTPPPPPDGDSASQIAKDGALAAILGGLSMIARILMSEEKASFGFIARRFFAAATVTAFVGIGTKDHFSSTGLWLAAAGGAGWAAPEITDYFIRWVKAKGAAEVSKANGKTDGKARKKRK